MGCEVKQKVKVMGLVKQCVNETFLMDLKKDCNCVLQKKKYT